MSLTIDQMLDHDFKPNYVAARPAKCRVCYGGILKLSKSVRFETTVSGKYVVLLFHRECFQNMVDRFND